MYILRKLRFTPGNLCLLVPLAILWLIWEISIIKNCHMLGKLCINLYLGLAYVNSGFEHNEITKPCWQKFYLEGCAKKQVVNRFNLNSWNADLPIVARPVRLVYKGRIGHLGITSKLFRLGFCPQMNMISWIIAI